MSRRGAVARLGSAVRTGCLTVRLWRILLQAEGELAVRHGARAIMNNGLRRGRALVHKVLALGAGRAIVTWMQSANRVMATIES